MKTNVLKSFAIFFLLFNVNLFFCFSQNADIIFTNGKIFTSDENNLFVEALAIKGNKILSVGSNEDIEKSATEETIRFDLQGKTVIPGLNDAHEHLGFIEPEINYINEEMTFEGMDKRIVLDSIAILSKIAKPNQWIGGTIGTKILFDTGVRSALDSLAPNNPVILQIWWGHGMVINKKTLEAAGISDSDKDPLGGWFYRDPSTNNISSIHENAQLDVWSAMSASHYEQQLESLKLYAQEKLKRGVTTIQQMSSNFNAEQSSIMFKKANLPQRIRIISWPRTTSAGRQMKEWENVTDSLAPLVYFSGIKYLLDGTPLEHNALNKEPYDEESEFYGRLNYPVDTIKQILVEAAKGDRQLMIHISGDSTLSTVLEIMKDIAPAEIWKTKRVRIEHNPSQNITDAELNYVKEFGLLMMHTPKYGQSSPIRSLLNKGIIVGISPDIITNPFLDIKIITSMQNNPLENVTIEQAVIAYTRTNSFAEFKEKEKGTLARGMLADLVVLSQDIFTVPKDLLPDTKSVITMIDGKIVYQQ
ncbi:MAG: amidohydrolase family protein [Fermentimonas sp.]|nr:amidohydrolase family protein [Fermentimonas sp.]